MEPKEFWVEELEVGLLWGCDTDLEPMPPPPEETEQRRESRSEAEADRSLQRCWVKWLGNTCRDGRGIVEKNLLLFTCDPMQYMMQ